MRSNGISFSARDLAIAHAEDTLNRVNSYKKGQKLTTPELQQRIKDMSMAYPTLPQNMVLYSALAGLNPEDDLALQLAQKNQEVMARKYAQEVVTKVNPFKRGVQLGMLALDAAFQPVSRGFKSAVVAAQETGRSVPATVAAATLGGLAETFVNQTPGQEGRTTANFLGSVFNPSVGEAFINARQKYGPTEFNLALQQLRKGNPLNLGTGYLPQSIDLTQTQVYLDEIRKGSDERTAMVSAANTYGAPITQVFDKREDQYKYTTKKGEKINISPGRVVAAQMLEPGSTGYSVVSGVIDGVFRVAADPVNLALAYGAGVKNAMRTLTSANTKALKATDNATELSKQLFKTFLPGKTGRQNRAIFYGRTVDDVRATGWGQEFGRAIAQLSGNEGMSFLNDIPEFRNIPMSVKKVLIEVDDPIHVWDVLDVVAKGGNLTDTQFDNMFTMMKQYVNKKTQNELDRVRDLTKTNKNFGLNAIPAKPTVTGEFFNYVGKIITGEATDVAPLRKFAGMFQSAQPAKGLLGVGAQMRMALPRHMQRALSLRPQTTAALSQLDETAFNVDANMKNAFIDASTRGKYTQEVLAVKNQKELDEVIFRVNQSIARSVGNKNKELLVDVESLIKQQQNFNLELEELRSFFKGSAGGSLSFNGTKVAKKYKTKIKDLQKHFESLGIEYDVKQVEEFVFEAVPSMHLLAQAGDTFTSIIDPQDVVRATKAHQTLIGPEDSRLRAWFNKPKNLLDDSDFGWTDFLKIPRKALQDNVSANRLTLKPKGPIDSKLDDLQNKILKPAWMLRLALMLRISPEEALRAAFGGKVNFITHAFQRMALNSNKQFGFFGDDVRADEVLQIYNNLGEIIMTTRMTPDDIEFLKNMIDVDDLKQFLAMDFMKSQKLLKANMLETNTQGIVSDYMVNAAVNNFDLRDLRFAELTEKAFKSKTKKIKATSKGSIVGYDGNTYNSMGEAFIKAGGFTTDLDERRYFDLQTRGPAEGDAFVSPYKDKEYSLGKIGDIERKAKELGIDEATYIDEQLDNIFFDEDTVGLLSKDKHVMGTYIDDDGNFLVDVSVGLQGDNAVANAVFIGANSFQESVYIANRELAEASGFGRPLQDNSLIYLYSKVKGPGYKSAADINIDTVLNQPTLEALFKSNFDALGLTVEEVKGAAKGLPGGSLFTTDETYKAAMGEAAITRGLLDGRKDLSENMFINVDKYLANGNINPRYWEGLWEELSLLASDPIVVPLVNKGIDDTMVYLRTDGKEVLEELVARSFNPEDRLYLQSDKALREYLESIQYRVGKVVGNPTAKIIDPRTGSELSAEMATRAWYSNGRKTYPKYVTDMSVGTNTKLFQFIKNGGVMEGKDWIRYNSHIQGFKLKETGKNNQQFYKEFIKLFKQEVEVAGLGPMRIPRKFDLKNRVSDSGTMIVGEEIQAAGYLADAREGAGALDTLLETGYNALISKPSNYLNRDPLFRYAFYENAIEVIKYMDDKTKAQFLKGAEPWIDGNKLWDELIQAAKEPSVENTITSLAQAEEVLKHGAMNEVKTLFYSISQRHVASDLFSKYIPFPEIWAEVFQSWGKLIADNPHKFNRARITVDNGDTAKPWDSENGFLERDPSTGKLMFNYVDVFNVLTLGSFKALGQLVRSSGVVEQLPDAITSPYQTAILGQDLEDEGVRATAPGYASGLNLIAQNGFAPGFGPVVTFPMRIFLNAIGASQGVRKFFLGEFEGSGQLSEQMPAWAKKFLTWEGSPDQDLQNAFATTAMDLYSSYVLAGLVNQEDPLEVNKYVDMAIKQARSVYLFRSAAQFSLPTAVQPRIEVEDKNGTWWGTQTLVNKYQEILIKNGYDNFAAQEEFVEKFGINPIPLKQPSSYKTGKQPTKENSFFWWQQDDRKRLLEADALPNTAYYIHPDKVEDELFWPAYYQTRSQGLDPREYATFMRQSQAIYEYEKGKKDIKENVPQSLQKEKLSELRFSIEEDYGFQLFNMQGKPRTAGTREIFAELDRWTDYELTRQSPEMKYLTKYIDYRNEIIDVLLNGGSFNYKGETLFVSDITKTSRTLNGTSAGPIRAREIMTLIWQDLVREGKDTNFPQLANEVLFYEISPNNRANTGD